MGILVKSIKLLGTEMEFNQFIRESGNHLSLGSGHVNLYTDSNLRIGVLSPDEPLVNSWTLKLNDDRALDNALAILGVNSEAVVKGIHHDAEVLRRVERAARLDECQRLIAEMRGGERECYHPPTLCAAADYAQARIHELRVRELEEQANKEDSK